MHHLFKRSLVGFLGILVAFLIGLSLYIYPRYTLSRNLSSHLFQVAILRQKISPYTIGFVSKKSKMGENEFIAKQTKVLKDLGWNYYIFYGPNAGHKGTFSHYLQSKIHEAIHWILGGDYVLSLSHNFPRPHVPYAYTYLTIGKDLVDENFLPTAEGQFIKEYDGIISSFPDNTFLLKAIKKLGLSTPVLQGYPTTYGTPSIPTLPKKIFYCGVNWDQLRGSQEYQQTLRSLVEDGLVVIYGTAKTWPNMRNLLSSPLPFDGYSVVKAIRDAGICLCLHSDIHLEAGIPTGRIFEAAAAQAVIISDHHPFIHHHFGNTVLYVDHTHPHESLASQLRRHYAWIQAHPQEAQAMAKKAHQIFVQNFTSEKLWEKLTQVHEKIKEAKTLKCTTQK